jgi:hypothetical protein
MHALRRRAVHDQARISSIRVRQADAGQADRAAGTRRPVAGV